MDNLLHIYSQYAHHCDAHIIGTREALTRLRGAIDKVLESGGTTLLESMVSDGEGFLTFVTLIGHNTAGTDNANLATPYRADYAEENRENAIFPPDLLKVINGK